MASSGASCSAIDQGYDLGRVDPLAVGADFYGFELIYRCADATPSKLLNSVLFGSMPGHVDFARIRTQGHVVEQLFTAGQQQLALPAAGAPMAAGVGAYLRIGLTHVLGSADHWLLLLGAVLLVRRRRDVGYLMLALAGGYLVSLAVSCAGWIEPRASLVEAFVGLLVALLAQRWPCETDSPAP